MSNEAMNLLTADLKSQLDFLQNRIHFSNEVSFNILFTPEGLSLTVNICYALSAINPCRNLLFNICQGQKIKSGVLIDDEIWMSEKLLTVYRGNVKSSTS